MSNRSADLSLYETSNRYNLKECEVLWRAIVSSQQLSSDPSKRQILP
jgi:hypothetical protein